LPVGLTSRTNKLSIRLAKHTCLNESTIVYYADDVLAIVSDNKLSIDVINY